MFFNLEFLRKIWDFSEQAPTFLDVLIIGLGIFILVYQIGLRSFNPAGRFCRKAREDKFFIARTEIKMAYIVTLIELLPLLGILGTVWGLAGALKVLSDNPMALISDIAKAIYPALSTTFFGLLFAALNLFVYNFLSSYLAEMIAWCKQGPPEISINPKQTRGQSENEHIHA